MHNMHIKKNWYGSKNTLGRPAVICMSGTYRGMIQRSLVSNAQLYRRSLFFHEMFA